MHIRVTYVHTHAPGSARPTAAAAELRRGGGAIHVAAVARIIAAAAAVPRLLPTQMPIYMCCSRYTEYKLTKYNCYTHKYICIYMITYMCMYTHMNTYTYVCMCIYKKRHTGT